MSDVIWATAFLVVIVGSILALLLGVYLDHRQVMARIEGGIPQQTDPLAGRQRALGWGAGFLFAGVGLFLGSLLFGLPGEQGNEGMGAGVVIAALGLGLMSYAYLAPRLRV